MLVPTTVNSRLPSRNRSPTWYPSVGVGHRLARATRQPAGVELGRPEPARHDAEHVHVLALQVLPRVDEGVGALDTGRAGEHTGDRLGQQPRRRERAGATGRDHEPIGTEERDDPIGLVAEVRDGSRHEQREPERERGGENGHDEPPASMEEIEQADAPHEPVF